MYKYEELEISPRDLRFMSDSISCRFRNGNSVNETVDQIETGKSAVYDLPKIRVVQLNNEYYSFDNRRLYVYRCLNCRGLLDRIKVKLAPISQYDKTRHTTMNGGKCVKVRRGVTLFHA